MGLESEIYIELSNSVALTALVSGSIYPEHRYQDSPTPAVVFWRAPGGFRVHDAKGYTGKENPTIELTVYATAVDMRRQVADECITTMTESTRFRALLPDPPFDDYDDDTQTYERILQFSVWN